MAESKNDKSSKVYFSIVWAWKSDNEFSSDVYSIDATLEKDEIESRLKSLFEGVDLTWVDSGNKYNIDSVIGKVADRIISGEFTDVYKVLYPHELVENPEDYLYHISFIIVPQRFVEL